MLYPPREISEDSDFCSWTDSGCPACPECCFDPCSGAAGCVRSGIVHSICVLYSVVGRVYSVWNISCGISRQTLDEPPGSRCELVGG